MTSFRTTHIDCVILTAFDSTFTFLRNTWALAGVRAHHASSLEQADFLLLATEATVLLSDIAIVDCSWRSALDMLAGYHSLVTMLVMADPADRPYLNDAFKLGVFGIVWKPIQFDAVIRLIGTAHQACRDRHVLRQQYGQSASFFVDRHTVSDQ